jgi:hypothetical protein
VTLNFPTISLIVFNPVMSVQAPVLHQRVYRNKGNHRRIGLLTDVDGDFVRVLWAHETASSGLTAYHGLTAVSIHVGATVTRGITYPAQPITALTPLFGVVNVHEHPEIISQIAHVAMRHERPANIIFFRHACASFA